MLPRALPQLLEQYLNPADTRILRDQTRSESGSVQGNDYARPKENLRSTGDLEGFEAYAMMAPQYAYGRHRGPAPRSTLQAAVLIALVRDERENWSIPLTLRPAQMQEHAGQVSLPGGRAERGENAIATAFREFEEELGWEASHLKPLGELPSIYVYASRHRVEPVIAFASKPPEFSPNPQEVAELILLPLEELLAPSAIDVGVLQRGTMQFKAPGYWIGEHFVWGATAMILTEFREVLLKTIANESL